MKKRGGSFALATPRQEFFFFKICAGLTHQKSSLNYNAKPIDWCHCRSTFFLTGINFKSPIRIRKFFCSSRIRIRNYFRFERIQPSRSKKKSRKILVVTVLWLLIPYKVISKKNLIFIGILKANDEKTGSVSVSKCQGSGTLLPVKLTQQETPVAVSSRCAWSWSSSCNFFTI